MTEGDPMLSPETAEFLATILGGTAINGVPGTPEFETARDRHLTARRELDALRAAPELP